MMEAFRRPFDSANRPVPRPGFSPVTIKGLHRLAAWLVLPALLNLAVGCGGGSAKKAKESTAVADAGQAQEEEAPAEAAPRVMKKKKAVQKAAELEAPPAPSTKDITKWKAADLDSALARKDVQFVPAVVDYSVSKPNDAKRADELDSLLRRVGRMKDDSPTIPLVLPPGAFAEADNQATSTTGQAGAPGATKPELKLNFGRHRRDK